jgi:hypothetical protein
LTTSHQELSSQQKGHQDHECDDPGFGRRAAGEQRLPLQGARSARARQERDQASGDRLGIPVRRREINEVILLVAVSFGIRARLAASSQGSRSSRASAEMTLSNIPFLSSPIGANKKSSNSDRWREAEAERVIAVTEFSRLWGQ